MKEMKGIAPVVIAVVIVVAIVAAAGVLYVTQPAKKEVEPGLGPFSRTQTVAWGANFYGPLANINPITEARLGVGYEHVTFIYEPLAMLSPDGRWIPILAKEWDWVDDYTLEVKIYPEARFRKGQPVTAEDVKFSYDTLADSTISGILDLINYSDLVESVEVVDEKTLRFHTLEEVGPRHPRVYQVLAPPVRIFQKERWEQLLENYGADIGDYANLDPEEINGSGPYNLYSNSAESTIYMRFENYWGNQIGRYYAPIYYQALYLGTADIVSRAFTDGDLDLGEMVGITRGWIEARKQPEGWLWMVNPGAPDVSQGVVFEFADFILTFNMDIEILRQQWLREAMAYAIDYAKVIQVEATAEIGAQSGPYYLPFYLPPEYYNSDITDEYYETETVAGVSVIAHDPEKAVEVLSEHCTGSVEEGWTYDGTKIGPFELLIWDYAPVVAASTVIANSLTDIGIEASVDIADWGLYLARCESGAYDFDIRWSAYWFGTFPNSIVTGYTMAFLTPGTCWGGSKVDYWRYWDGTHPPLPDTAGEVEDLVDQLWYLEAGTDDFIEIVRQIQEILIPQLPMIPLYQKISPMMLSALYWVNLPYMDDPLDYLPKVANEFHGNLMHYYPKWIETLDATLSSNTVKAGKSVKVEVTLRNTGTATTLYPVKVHEGPAVAGEYLYEPEKLLAHKAVLVGAGQTRTVELEVTIDTPGTYTLTVDCWRHSEYDPGEPRELSLTVT